MVSCRRDRTLDAVYVPEECTLSVSLLDDVLSRDGKRESCNPQRRYKSPPLNRDKRVLLTARYYMYLVVPEDLIGNDTLRSRDMPLVSVRLSTPYTEYRKISCGT